jgi:hypothetical protein
MLKMTTTRWRQSHKNGTPAKIAVANSVIFGFHCIPSVSQIVFFDPLFSVHSQLPPERLY